MPPRKPFRAIPIILGLGLVLAIQAYADPSVFSPLKQIATGRSNASELVFMPQPDLLQASHRQWMVDRRKGKSLVAQGETLVAMTESLDNPDPSAKKKCDKISGGDSLELGSKKRASKKAKTRSSKG